MEYFNKNWTEDERKEKLAREMIAWGAYVGEVIRRNILSSTDWVIPDVQEERQPYFRCGTNKDNLSNDN